MRLDWFAQPVLDKNIPSVISANLFFFIISLSVLNLSSLKKI